MCLTVYNGKQSDPIEFNRNRCSGMIYDTNSLLSLLEYSICVYCALGVLTNHHE